MSMNKTRGKEIGREDAIQTVYILCQQLQLEKTTLVTFADQVCSLNIR